MAVFLSDLRRPRVDAVHSVQDLCVGAQSEVAVLCALAAGDERFPEALQLVKEQKLYSEALRLYTDRRHYKVLLHARTHAHTSSAVWMETEVSRCLYVL